ncbi:class II aldolase/adducin family protein [Natranaerobius thermophilus]|uniref:Class II aldolase/adducin family protein n=1 Tax=Natranaerobius thermophilus (strain ATCC BAA-1301 / DSM 18059 / JW/NM-WN-LF) TaxID=457570 RepID=B2A7G7_NATTJ|nr:class II aldolase/adducin family protein [Natranaerobius thermophilus]ACB85676.1 class II aldolase/adducin family protein [Natranaerobius thermophilus JW/NM-WN-LF]
MLLKDLRTEVIKCCRKLADNQLTPGTTGNVSALNREEGLMAISPSGLEYHDMTVEEVVVMDLDGNVIEGKGAPSSEWPLHLKCYQHRQDLAGVVHTHSIYSTIFSCLNQSIEPVHYMIAFSGLRVPCAEYARPGSEELAVKAVEELENYNAVLLANHGLLTAGKSLREAFVTAEQVEFVAEIYYKTKALAEPVIISDQEMSAIINQLGNYGR